MKSRFRKLSINRKMLSLVFCIMLVSVLSLTIVYAALATTLNITGNAEVIASSWDIYLDNVQLVSGSVTQTKPTITNKTTASFTAELATQGDYYIFTIDVVNKGSIDAMIDSITKTPTLTETQAKYLNYIVEYQNGESINTKQVVKKDSFVRLKVKLEYRNDINPNDLPTQPEELNLSFTVNYIQAADNDIITIQNSGKLIKIVSGDGSKMGDEICIGEECFYVITSTEETVTMLSKYFLSAGNSYDDVNKDVPLKNPTGIQDKNINPFFNGYTVDNPLTGTIRFSKTNYWSSTVSSYPVYLYNENSNIYEHIENYRRYLEGLGADIQEARLLSLEETKIFGCPETGGDCNNLPRWANVSAYWTGIVSTYDHVYIIMNNKLFNNPYNRYDNGIRPVIVISKNILY